MKTQVLTFIRVCQNSSLISTLIGHEPETGARMCRCSREECDCQSSLNSSGWKHILYMIGEKYTAKLHNRVAHWLGQGEYGELDFLS